jgi:hypothetical protein
MTPKRTFSQSTLIRDTINSADPLAEEEGPSITIGVTCVRLRSNDLDFRVREGRSEGSQHRL